jgi:hypothetical protein
MSPLMIFDTDPDGGYSNLRWLLGTPGSFGIPQTTTQLVMNVCDFGFDMQGESATTPQLLFYFPWSMKRDGSSRRARDKRKESATNKAPKTLLFPSFTLAAIEQPRVRLPETSPGDPVASELGVTTEARIPEAVRHPRNWY